MAEAELIGDEDTTVLLTFEHSRKALDALDASAPARLRNWQLAQTEEQVRACELADAEALVELRQAFYEDTKCINSRESCNTVDLADIRWLLNDFRPTRRR